MDISIEPSGLFKSGHMILTTSESITTTNMYYHQNYDAIPKTEVENLINYYLILVE